MTVTKLNFDQTYEQSEHQRAHQQIVDAINTLQSQLVLMQAQLTSINLKLGIK